jgi:hypothetical protein
MVFLKGRNQILVINVRQRYDPENPKMTSDKLHDELRQIHEYITKFFFENIGFKRELEKELKGTPRKLLSGIIDEGEPKRGSWWAERKLHVRRSTVSRALVPGGPIDNALKIFSAEHGMHPPLQISGRLEKSYPGIMLHCGRARLGAIKKRFVKLLPKTVDKTQLLLVLDGMTYARLAELIIGYGKTEKERAMQRNDYRKSLEDFLFGALLFDKLGADRKLWEEPEKTGDKLASIGVERIDATYASNKIQRVSTIPDLQSYTETVKGGKKPRRG